MAAQIDADVTGTLLKATGLQSKEQLQVCGVVGGRMGRCNLARGGRESRDRGGLGGVHGSKQPQQQQQHQQQHPGWRRGPCRGVYACGTCMCRTQVAPPVVGSSR